jgi:hypothetical protein
LRGKQKTADVTFNIKCYIGCRRRVLGCWDYSTTGGISCKDIFFVFPTIFAHGRSSSIPLRWRGGAKRRGGFFGNRRLSSPSEGNTSLRKTTPPPAGAPLHRRGIGGGRITIRPYGATNISKYGTINRAPTTPKRLKVVRKCRSFSLAMH